MKHAKIIATVDGHNRTITECQCCGHTFTPTKAMHYVAKDADPGKTTIFQVAAEAKQYDAFDCPNCGCQIIAGERLKPVDEAVFALGDIDEVHDNGKEDTDSDQDDGVKPAINVEELDETEQ